MQRARRGCVGERRPRREKRTAEELSDIFLFLHSFYSRCFLCLLSLHIMHILVVERRERILPLAQKCILDKEAH